VAFTNASQLNVKTFVVLFIEISMTNEFLVYISVKSIIVDIPFL
jgi:hypothetical protein